MPKSQLHRINMICLTAIILLVSSSAQQQNPPADWMPVSVVEKSSIPPRRSDPNKLLHRAVAYFTKPLKEETHNFVMWAECEDAAGQKLAKQIFHTARFQSVGTQRSSSAVPADVAKYIGFRGTSLPDGLSLIGGALVSEVNDDKAYVLDEVHKGRIKMFWFSGSTRRDGRLHDSEVKDVLVLPRVRTNQVVVYSTCFLQNRRDKEIVAVVAYEAGVEYFTRVYKAWRANRTTERFEEIPVKGIKCENEGYGV